MGIECEQHSEQRSTASEHRNRPCKKPGASRRCQAQVNGGPRLEFPAHPVTDVVGDLWNRPDHQKG